MKPSTINKIETIIGASILASSINVNAQNGLERINTNEIYLTLDPGAMAPGVRYQKRFPYKLYPLGAYGEISKGFGDYYLKNHFKIGVGPVIYLKREVFKKIIIFGGGGVSYHAYRGDTSLYNREEEKKLDDPFAFDLCVGGRIGRFNLVIEVVPQKKYGVIGALINFGGLARSKDICASNQQYKNNKPKGKQYNKFNR